MHKQTIRPLILVVAGCGLVVAWLLHGTTPKRPTSIRPLSATLPNAPLAQDKINRALAIESERQHLDQTVWAKELLAQKHEDVFVQLWDDLRTNHETTQVLSQFSFGELILGTPSPATNAAHGIAITHFGDPNRTLTMDSWRALLEQFKAEGYQLAQSEWRHPRFDSDEKGTVRSTIAMTMHVSNPGKMQRLIVRGELGVRWRENPDPSGSPFPEQIDATALEVLSQSGETAFEKVLAREVKTELNPVFIDPLILHDLTGDGLSELILVGQNLVYENLGKGTFRARQLCEQPTPSITTAVIADFDGDGKPDLLGADQDGLILYPGGSSPQFEGAPRRIHFSTAELANPFVMTAGDVNGDGFLDIWLAQYKLPYLAGQMPTPYFDANDGFASFLLLNDGHGNFHDATREAGLADKRFRRTYSASFVDLDDDGDLDLVVVSDFAGVDLYYNDGHGHFTDATSSAVDEPHAFGMAHTFGDYDGDGLLDLMVIGMNSHTAARLDHLGLGPAAFPQWQAMRPKMAYGNRLYFQRDGAWRQCPLSDQVARSGWSWGVTSFDFDNDGRLDLYIANGHKSRSSAKEYDSQFWRHDIYIGTSAHDAGVETYFEAVGNRLYGAGQSYGGYEKNRLYLNQDGKSFIEMGFLAGVAMEDDCRDVVSDDLDGDGKLDLIVTSEAIWPRARQALHIFRNRLEPTGNWIGFRLQESAPGYSPIGVKIRLTTASGSQLRQIVTGDSFRSQHSNTAHFGLGSDTSVETVDIRWPNGRQQQLHHPLINRYYSIAADVRADASK